MKVFCDQVPLFNVYLVPSIFHHVRRFVPYIKFLSPDPTLNFQLILCTNVEILILYVKLYYRRIQIFSKFFNHCQIQAWFSHFSVHWYNLFITVLTFVKILSYLCSSFQQLHFMSHFINSNRSNNFLCPTSIPTSVAHDCQRKWLYIYSIYVPHLQSKNAQSNHGSIHSLLSSVLLVKVSKTFQTNNFHHYIFSLVVHNGFFFSKLF